VPQSLHRASEWSWRLLLIGAAIFVVGWMLSKVFLLVVVVMAALLLTSVFHPPAARLRRRGWSARLSTTVSMIAGLLLVATFVAVLVPQIADEFAKVGDQAAAGVRQAQEWLIHGPLHLSTRQVDNIANGLVRQLQGGGGSSLVTGVVSGAVAAGSIIAAILLTEPDGLCVGRVALDDGTEVLGVLAEPALVEGRREITEYGGWRGYVASRDTHGADVT